MKQIIQNYKTGEIQLVEIPPPALKRSFVLVQNVTSLVSVGTEKYMLEIAKKSLLGKARARPDLVKQVIKKLKAEGIMETYKAVMAKLDIPVPLGYSCAGIVLDVGEGVESFKKGDKIACAGSSYASHAEIVCVPVNLCVHLPKRHVNRENKPIINSRLTNDYISFEEGAFAALGGIALQAVRLANPSLGDRVAVIGLGLLGQITVQLLKANGCHVFGIDISEERVKMAIENGAGGGVVSREVDVINSAREFAPQGFDSVIIMAATKSNEPLEISAEVARERGKIIASGLVGLEIPRKIFFEKELELCVSRAWGPGIFDPLYTEKNIDYPYAYARWTAKRNMEEFLHQIAKGNVNVKKLITHRFKIDDALKAYEMILKGKESFLGVIIQYPSKEVLDDSISVSDWINVRKYEIKVEKKVKEPLTLRMKTDVVTVGVIGAGVFATGTILPILKKMENVRLKGVATATGYKAQHVAKKFGFKYFTTNYKEILNDKEINLIFIMTRHDSHAYFIIETLKANKNIFVEKPLCINIEQLKEIISNYQSQITNNYSPILMVGFNRRFSPFSVWLREKFRQIQEPLSIHITINAGYVPPEHWVHDPENGGGRIIGEVCHFIDLIQYFTDSLPVEVFAQNLESRAYKESDNVSIILKMQNGAIGSILYIASGDKRYTRERVEIFGGGAVGVIDNFRKAEFIYKGEKKKIKNWFGIDRGHRKEMEVLMSAIKKEKNPVSF
ncbi:bi-domain-containing oxidoreductase, partial [Candidatus Aminicenantes bacterium AC-334-E05]|nr:bi-domain-containing oxidoreductase [Candidatus Aminicenantes bacterium AC-334-E05]